MLIFILLLFIHFSNSFDQISYKSTTSEEKKKRKGKSHQKFVDSFKILIIRLNQKIIFIMHIYVS